MAASPPPKLSPADYLALDRASDVRHEYLDGLMGAMSGGTSNHSFLIANVAHEIKLALGSRRCNMSVGDLRLQVTAGESYFYPDVMVLCPQPQYLDDRKDTVTNPTLIVEVLSNSTERWDRVGKFTQYRRLASLKEYVLVAQDEMRIEWYTLRDNGEWVYREAHGPEAHCHLDSLNLSIALAAVYSGIEIVR